MADCYFIILIASQNDRPSIGEKNICCTIAMIAYLYLLLPMFKTRNFPFSNIAAHIENSDNYHRDIASVVRTKINTFCGFNLFALKWGHDTVHFLSAELTMSFPAIQFAAIQSMEMCLNYFGSVPNVQNLVLLYVNGKSRILDNKVCYYYLLSYDVIVRS